MKAIVIVSSIPEDAILEDRYAAPLLPLVDRAFLQHLVEYLVDRGITHIDFVVSHLPDRVEHLLGNGTRWGAAFTHHPAPDAAGVYSLLPLLESGAADSVLLVHGDRLPRVDPGSLAATGSPTVVLTEAGDWTGWAMVPGTLLPQLASCASETDLAGMLRSLPAVQNVTAPEMLDARSLETLLQAQQIVAANRFPGLLRTGRAVSGEGDTAGDTIRTARGASVHPGARLIAPVFIGENSQIGAGCVIGPNAVVSDHCTVGERTVLENMLLLPGSFVGEGLELRDAVIERNRLVSVRHGESLTVTDSFLLGDLSHNPTVFWWRRVRSQAAGAALLMVFLPFLFLTALLLRLFRSGPLLFRHEYLILPTTADTRDWHTYNVWSFCPDPRQASGFRHLTQVFLPGLLAVASGRLALVGVTPRTRDQVSALPRDYRAVYLNGSAGLISETWLSFENLATVEDEMLIESFYSVSATPMYDARLVGRYLGKCLSVNQRNTLSESRE
ncbi:MAG: hypothetical protein OHK0029_12490 [Armatimonadaceae bacterium]